MTTIKHKQKMLHSNKCTHTNTHTHTWRHQPEQQHKRQGLKCAADLSWDNYTGSMMIVSFKIKAGKISQKEMQIILMIA